MVEMAAGANCLRKILVGMAGGMNYLRKIMVGMAARANCSRTIVVGRAGGMHYSVDSSFIIFADRVGRESLGKAVSTRRPLITRRK